jgi:hypothetical protein
MFIGLPIAVPAHDLRTHDAVTKARLRGERLQIVLLLPIEVGAFGTRIAFATGIRHRSQMCTVRLRALQQRHVLERGHVHERVEQVLEHRLVGGDLLRIAPTGDQLGLLVQRRVRDVRDVTKLRAFGESLASGTVGQVHLHELRTAGEIRLAA